MGKTLIRTLADSDATVALGAELAQACHQSATIFLHGDLGAGKTFFINKVLSTKV